MNKKWSRQLRGGESADSLVLLARRDRFLSCVHFLLLAWHFQDTLRSKASFCVTVAGHRTLFHPRGRRVSFWTLLKRWQAWVKMRGGFGGHFSWQARYWWTWTTFSQGRQSCFVNLSPFVIGHDDDSVWQVQHYDLTRPSYKNLRASQNFHTTTSNADHLQDLNARTSEGGFEQNLHKILSQGPVQVMHRHPEDFTRTSSRSSHSLTGACTRSCKDLPGFRPDLDKIFS